MKHRVSVVCMLACALCLALGLAGCSQSGSYEGKTLTPTVSAPTIGTNGTLRVGIDADGGAPFITSKSSAQYAGLDVDMAAALADQLGLKLELVDVAGNAAKALSDGDVDIVMGQSSSEKSTSMWMSDPYLETGVALFASGSNSVPTQAAAGSIAAQSSSTSAWAVENAFGDEALNPSSDLVSAFSLIETGKATYVAADAVIGSYAALRQNVDVKPIALLGSKGGYCIGASSSNQNLQKAISGALTAVMGNGVADAVCAKWLGSPVDLDSITTIEVSASKSSAANSVSGESGEAGSGTASTTSETASTSTAGANAIQPNSTSSSN